VKPDNKTNPDVRAEYLCMSKCIDAIEELERYYINQSGKNDSVAEDRANRAMVRCLQWIVSFKIRNAFIAGRKEGA
jgi:hypothetical protein